MSPNCVNKSNPAFKQLAKDLNVSEHSLELLAHEYNMLVGNAEGTAFLTDAGKNWINQRLNGTSQEALPEVVKLWQEQYSEPQTFDDVEAAASAEVKAKSFFGDNAVVLKETADGKYELKVAQPINIVDSMQRLADSVVNNSRIARNATERKKAWGRFVDNQEARGYFVDGKYDPNTTLYTITNVSLTHKAPKVTTVKHIAQRVIKQRYDVRRTKEKIISDQALADQERTFYLDTMDYEQAIQGAIDDAANDIMNQIGWSEGTEYSADEALAAYAKLPDYPTYKALADMVFAKCKELGIKFQVNPAISGYGVYHNDTKTVEINKEIQVNTLLHEALHATTDYFLNSKNKKRLPVEVQAAIKELQECYRILKEDFIAENPGAEIYGDLMYEGDAYGLQSINEFIAELSNPEFRRRIQNFDKQEHPGIFSRLIDAIAKLLGIKKDYKNVETTAYQALKTLLTNTDTTLADEYVSEMKKLRKVTNILQDFHNSFPTISLNEELTAKLENIEDVNSKGRTLSVSADSFTPNDIKSLKAGSMFIFSTVHGNAMGVVDSITSIDNEKVVLKYSLVHYTDIDNYTISKENGYVYLTPKVEEVPAAKETESATDRVQRFLSDQQRFYNEIKAIQDSGRLSNTEVRQVAADVAYAVSDLITQVQKGEIDINQLVPGKQTKKPISEMSRAEILQFIGVYTPGETFDTDSGAFAYVRRTYFGDLNKMKGEGEELRTNRKAAVTINKNFRAIVELAAEEIVNVEGFGLRVVEGRPTEVLEGMNINVDDFNNDEDAVSILEREGDLQEHWQVNFRTIDVLGSMSQIVRQALLQCYKLDAAGNPIESRFGIKERVSAREATSQILRWTQGAIDMKSMIAKLKEHEKSSPWITQIISRLTDENKTPEEYGADTDFRSQFYNVFSKHFQLYTSIIEDADHKYYSAPSNEHPALKDIITQLQAAIATDQVPMFQGGRVSDIHLAVFKGFSDALPGVAEKQFEEMTAEQKDEAQTNIWKALWELGITIDYSQLQDSWNYKNYKDIQSALHYIGETLTKHLQDENYDPLAFKEGIRGNLMTAVGALIGNLEDIAVSSFYDNGKTYQSYVTPSYLTKFLQKMRLQGEEFDSFVENEFGQYDWFKDSEGNWRNPWIRDIVVKGHEQSGQECGNIPYSELFAHKVELNFDKHGYMREMSPAEYALSILAEFFTASEGKEGIVPAWYRVTMLSNKPSAEYIRFKRYADLSTYKENVLNDIMQVFAQELGRIKTTKARNEIYDKKSLEYIKNLDKNGRRFVFLPYLNDATGRLKELIDRKTDPHGEALSIEEEAELNQLARKAISDHITKRAGEIIAKWEKNGVAEAATKIKGLNKNNVRAQLENFIWNDTLASMMIDEIFITDRALYKNTEDLQKRMAQIHAPGVRGDIYAVDYDGHRVSDGTYRAVLLKDFDGFKSNVIDNLREVFNRREQGLTGEDLKAARALHDNIIKQYEGINVADAQAYSSITSRRKKDFIMGLWSREKEDLYQKIKGSDYSDEKLATMFTIINACEVEKPFCYSQIKKSTKTPDGIGMSNYKVGVQFKNSEYLLIMADAILEKEHTTRPNLLRAINRFMEDSIQLKDKEGVLMDRRGIDTVQFESAAKGLNQGAIDIAKFANVAGGENLALLELQKAAYTDENMTEYNKSVVQEIPFEDWCIQQPVPNHFYDHAQQQGSQGRMIVISDLADTFNGEPVEFEVYGEKYTAQGIREEYEQNAAANIEASLEDVNEELGLNLTDRKERNIAIAEILQREIKSSPRYGTDLLKACTLDANGEFIIPLSDPIQAKRIEQLLNSIIKNRVNKQEIAGGPVVQVSNFGTSDELNIRFQDKQGNLLPTKKEFEEAHPGESYKDYIAKNQGKLAYYEVYVSRFEGVEKYERKDGTVDMERIEKECPELLDLICSRIPTEDKYSMAPCRIKGFLPKFAGAGIMMPADITTITGCDFDVDKMYIMRKQFLQDENGNYVFPHDKTTTIGRNNRNVEMMRVILTHESNLDKLFNPGGFEPQKKMGYMVQAYKQGASDWDTLQSIADNKTQVVEQEDGTFEFQPYDAKAVKDGDALGGTDALKALSYQASDISFVDTQIQFYEQNSAAASILAIFAVAKVAHATLENNKFRLVLNGVDDSGVGLMHPAKIGDFQLGTEGDMTAEIDPTKNILGQYIGKDLGCLVASAADAVKDPVLNLMNINKETVNVLNTLIRLGMPFNDAAMFLSQQVITDTIQQFYKERIEKGVTLSDIVAKRLSEYKDMGDADRIDISKEALIKGLRDSSDVKTTYQTLYMFDKVLRMANALSGINFLTRFNSIANAVGPLIIDNIMKENKLDASHYSQILSTREDGSYRSDGIVGTVFAKHPILRQFSRTLGTAQRLFTDFPEYKGFYENALRERNIGLEKVVMGNRDILNKYSDFFKSAMLVSNGTINITELSHYVNEYAKDFLKIKKDDKYKDNLLVQAIRVAKDKSGSLYLKVDSGVLNDPTLKGNLSAAWADLLVLDEKVALDLFKYNFFRGGIGFTPRTFMNLVPVEVKLAFPGYVETYRKGIPEYLPELGRMFVQNHWRDNKIAPTRDLKDAQGKNAYTLHMGGVLEVRPEICNVPYFKMQDDEKNYHLYEKVDKGTNVDYNEYHEIPILGGNGEYMEFYTSEKYKPIQKVATETSNQTKIDTNETPTEANNSESISEDMTVVDTEVATYAQKFTVKSAQEQVETAKLKEGMEYLGLGEKVETNDAVKEATLDSFQKRGIEVKAEDIDKTIEDKNPC